MGAKQKLNSINTLGVLAVAAVIGGMAGSWAVFLIVAAVLWAVAVGSGDIRRWGPARQAVPCPRWGAHGVGVAVGKLAAMAFF